MIGRIIGTYKIEEKLGEGGMGAVYKGVDTMLDREVAIKALKPELASQTAVVERFRSEAVTLAKLHHPNIATLYSLFRQGDELYMVLEYVRGETLDSILQRRGALPVNEVIPVFCQILDGINHAHEYGIIHRDIKPANMMVTEKGTLKVLDFGIARLLGSTRMTRMGNVIGTLEYMAPEQVKGQETDARSDIYALGMMLYEVLTGRIPFETENEFELMKMQTEQMPVPPRVLNPSIPEEVEAAILKAIQKNPDNRFQVAGEFREALMDAGFAAQGILRQTGTLRQSEVFHTNSLPPISKPDSSSQPSVVENTIKETRLGTQSAGSVSNNREMKETRLGESVNTAPFGSDLYKSTPSFLTQLTWIHYAGAGTIGAALLALLIAVPVLMFGGSTPAAANVKETKPTATPVVENKTPKTEVMMTPTPTPTPDIKPTGGGSTDGGAMPVSTPIISPINTPTDSGAATTTKTRQVDRPNPNPPPRPNPAPVKKKNGGKTIDQTRCALTGDC